MSIKNLDEAFEKFQARIKEMTDDEFWESLGTSIDELKDLAKKDGRRMRLGDLISNSEQWADFCDAIYSTCDSLDAPTNREANSLIDQLSDMEIIVPNEVHSK